MKCMGQGQCIRQLYYKSLPCLACGVNVVLSRVPLSSPLNSICHLRDLSVSMMTGQGSCAHRSIAPPLGEDMQRLQSDSSI